MILFHPRAFIRWSGVKSLTLLENHLNMDRFQQNVCESFNQSPRQLIKNFRRHDVLGVYSAYSFGIFKNPSQNQSPVIEFGYHTQTQ